MSFKRRSWRRRSSFGRKPRSYKAFYRRKRAKVSYKTKFKRGGICR